MLKIEIFFCEVNSCLITVQSFPSKNIQFSKARHGPGRVGAQSGLGPGPGWGPYGPIWALMGLYGPIWAHVGPYGPVWAHMDPAWALEERESSKKTHLFL